MSDIEKRAAEPLCIVNQNGSIKAEITQGDYDLIEDALNAYLNLCYQQSRHKGNGDLEAKLLQLLKTKLKGLMAKL